MKSHCHFTFIGHDGHRRRKLEHRATNGKNDSIHNKAILKMTILGHVIKTNHQIPINKRIKNTCQFKGERVAGRWLISQPDEPKIFSVMLMKS